MFVQYSLQFLTFSKRKNKFELFFFSCLVKCHLSDSLVVSHPILFLFLKSLFDIISKIDLVTSGKLGAAVKPKSLVTTNMGTVTKCPKKPFDAMNNIVANLLLSLTR